MRLPDRAARLLQPRSELGDRVVVQLVLVHRPQDAC